MILANMRRSANVIDLRNVDTSGSSSDAVDAQLLADQVQMQRFRAKVLAGGLLVFFGWLVFRRPKHPA